MRNQRLRSGPLRGALRGPTAQDTGTLVPRNAVSYFDAAAIPRETSARRGTYISRWPGQLFGGVCDARPRLTTHGGNVLGGMGRDYSVWVGEGNLLQVGCQFWRPAGEELHIFLVASVTEGFEAALASETSLYERDAGLQIEVIGDHLCVSRRGGEPFMRSATRFTYPQTNAGRAPANGRLVHLWHEPPGFGEEKARWELRVDGALEAATYAAPLAVEERPEAHFRIGQPPSDNVEGGPFGYLHEGAEVAMSLNVRGALPREELGTIEREAERRWGVQLRTWETFAAVPGVFEAIHHRCINTPPSAPHRVVDMRCVAAEVEELRAGGGGATPACQAGSELMCVPSAWIEDPEAWLKEARGGGNLTRPKRQASEAGFSYWPVIAAGGLALLLAAANG